MDFQTEYDTLTKKIDDTLTTQVSSSLTWDNIPGNFTKAVSSGGGYAWAFQNIPNDARLYNCQLPCTGNWVEVDLKDYKTHFIIGMAIDNINVYVLVGKLTGSGSNKTVNLLTNVVSGKGEWTNLYSTTTGAASPNIYSTRNFLWFVEIGSDVIKKCPKPCTAGNWMNQPNPQKIIITSSTDTELYGLSSITGETVKTDENMRTGWNVIKGLSRNQNIGLAVPIGADPQRSGTYALTLTGKTFNCKGDCNSPDDVVPVDNKNLGTYDLSYDSSSKNLWMTTVNPGEKGNIFTQVDKPDYTSILNTVDPLDKQRDEITKDVKKDYEQQTRTLITNKQIQTVVDFFNKQFGFTKKIGEQTKDESSALSKNIERNQKKIDKMTPIVNKIIKFIIVLVIVAFVYILAEPILGTTVHLIAIVVLIMGIIFTIYY